MIEKITQEEFGTAHNSKLSEESKAVSELMPESGIKFSCRWSHRPSCGGLPLFYKMANRGGFEISAKCRDGIVMVWRKE